MTVVYNGTLRNTRLGDVATAIDAGGANGALRLLDGGGNVLSTLPLARPCGSIASQVLTFAGMSLIDAAATGAGIATAARIEDSTGVPVITGLTVGTSSASDIILSSVAIAAGAVVAIQTATITGN